MSGAIRCGQCRWWRQKDELGVCELNPPVWSNADEFSGPGGWYQPHTDGTEEGCSRGEPKALPKTGDE